jgi:hypothetical protein
MPNARLSIGCAILIGTAAACGGQVAESERDPNDMSGVGTGGTASIDGDGGGCFCDSGTGGQYYTGTGGYPYAQGTGGQPYTGTGGSPYPGTGGQPYSYGGEAGSAGSANE